MASVRQRVLIGLTVLLGGSLAACHNPADDYQAFLDASASYRGQPPPIANSRLEDLTGDWFVHALLAGGIPLGLRMRFAMDVSQTPIPLTAKIFTGMADLDTATPLATSMTTVGSDGRFTLSADPLVLTKGTVQGLNVDVTANVMMDNYTQSPDAWCGVANGKVTMPFELDLSGSTLGARRDTAHTLTIADVPGQCEASDM